MKEERERDGDVIKNKADVLFQKLFLDLSSHFLEKKELLSIQQ